jgi:hypothetical protein
MVGLKWEKELGRIEIEWPIIRPKFGPLKNAAGGHVTPATTIGGIPFLRIKLEIFAGRVIHALNM